MKYFIAQPSKSSCGITSLKILLSLIYKNEDFKFLSYPKDLSYQYSLKDIINIAKDYGTILSGIEILDDDFFLKENNPYILLTKDNNHSVVIKKIFSFLYKVYDPNFGVKYVTKKYIKKHYSNIALIIKEFNKIDIEFNKEKLIKNTKVILVTTFHVISLFLAVISLYFIKKDSYFIIPVIIMLFSILSSIISKNLSFKYLEEYDEFIINNYKFNKNYYAQFCMYKKDIFVNKIKFFSSLFLILFIFLISSFNQMESLLIFSGTFLLGIIEHFLIKKQENNFVNKINNEEDELLQHYDIEKHKNINKNTYKYGRLLSYKKIIEIFIIFALAMISSMIVNLASLNYILFYVFIALFLLENTQNMLSYKEDELRLMRHQELIRAILNKFKN